MSSNLSPTPKFHNSLNFNLNASLSDKGLHSNDDLRMFVGHLTQLIELESEVLNLLLIQCR